MNTLLGILDFVVLLLLVISIPRIVLKELRQAAGSMLLTICVLAVLIVFAVVSLSAYVGLIGVSSGLTRGIFLVILLLMLGTLRFAWSGKPAA